MGRLVEAEGWLFSNGTYGRKQYTAFVPHELAGWSPSVPGRVLSPLLTAAEGLKTLGGAADVAAAVGAWLRARDESIRSSLIEGVRSTVAGLAWAQYRQAAGESLHDEEDALTLGASRQIDEAVDLGRRMKSGQDCTLDDLLSLHSALFAGTRNERLGGRLRDEPIWVGPPNCTIDQATFVAPPDSAVPELLEDLIRHVNDSDDPPLVLSAVTHAQFETIHPFEDGNGRTGRALIQAVLNARGALEGAAPISAALEADRRGYYRALGHYQTPSPAGDLAARDAQLLPWLEVFLGACRRAVTDGQRMNRRVREMQSNWRRRVRVMSGSTTDRLLDALPTMPVFTVETVCERLDVGERSARRAVDSLSEAGIIAAGARRNRKFTVPDVIDILSGASPEGGLQRTATAGREDHTRMRASAQCTHRGTRSKLQCVLAVGHAGAHRYR